MYTTFSYKSSILDKNNKINYDFLCEPGFSIPSINLKHILFSLSACKIRLLDYFFFMAIFNRGIFASQARIGANAGITRQWTNKQIKGLVSLGLLRKHYRHRKTCIYTIPKMLFSAKNIKWLVRLFPSIYNLLKNKLNTGSKFLSNIRAHQLSSRLEEVLGRNMFTQKKNDTEKTYEFLEAIKNLRELDDKLKIHFRGLLQCLGEFSLTQHGIIELCIFSSDVLLEALDRYQEEDVALLDDYFIHFVNICEEVAEERDGGVNNFLKDSMMRMYGIRRLGVLVGNKKQAVRLSSFLVLNEVTIKRKNIVRTYNYNSPSSFRDSNYGYDFNLNNDKIEPENITLEYLKTLDPLSVTIKAMDIKRYIDDIRGSDLHYRNLEELITERDKATIVRTSSSIEEMLSKFEAYKKSKLT
jgi:hypothetical protein